HGVIAGRERRLEHDLLRRHAGGIAGAADAVLERRELLLERAHGRVAAARVREAFRQVLIDRLLNERGRLVDRRQNRAGHGVRHASRVHLLGREAHRLAPWLTVFEPCMIRGAGSTHKKAGAARAAPAPAMGSWGGLWRAFAL